MSDTWSRITNPGTRSHKSLSNINTFPSIYHYITDGKLPSGTKAQNCICAEALSYVVVNNFLFRIDTQKDKDRDKGKLFLLVIPERYKPIILHTYHDSLLSGHQGPYRITITIRQKFFIHNLMNKVKRYIEACHTCLKTKHKYKKNRPVYSRIPVDYTPMQDLSIDIKMMPEAFGGYHLLLVITCDQTNFTIVVPLRDRQTQTVAKALIYRVIYLFGLPRQIVCDEATEFTSAIVTYRILNRLESCKCSLTAGNYLLSQTDTNCRDMPEARDGYFTTYYAFNKIILDIITVKFDIQVDDKTITQSTLLHDDIPGYNLLTLEFVLPPVDEYEDLILEEENPEIYAHPENVLVHMINTQDIAILKSQKDCVRNKQNFWNTYIMHNCGKSCQSYSPM